MDPCFYKMVSCKVASVCKFGTDLNAPCLSFRCRSPGAHVARYFFTIHSYFLLSRSVSGAGEAPEVASLHKLTPRARRARQKAPRCRAKPGKEENIYFFPNSVFTLSLAPWKTWRALWWTPG